MFTDSDYSLFLTNENGLETGQVHGTQMPFSSQGDCSLMSTADLFIIHQSEHQVLMSPLQTREGTSTQEALLKSRQGRHGLQPAM